MIEHSKILSLDLSMANMTNIVLKEIVLVHPKINKIIKTLEFIL